MRSHVVASASGLRPTADVLRRALSGVSLITLGLLVLYPLAMLVVGSLFTGRPGDLGDFTFQNFVDSWRFPWYWPTILRTVGTGAAAVAVASLISVPLAWIASRTDFPLARYLDYIGVAPLLISQFAIAIAWRLLASENLGLLNRLGSSITPWEWSINIDGFVGIVWVSALYFSPYIYLFTSNALRLVDSDFEDAAVMLGASTRQTIVKVTLPTILPSLLAGLLLVLILTLGQFTIPLILGWNSGFHLLTTKIYELTAFPPARYGLAASLSAIMVLIGLGLLYLYRMVTIRATRSFETIRGKGLRTSRVKLGRWKYPLVVVVLAYILFTILLPYTVLLLTSVSRFTNSGPPFTLDNFHELLNMHLFPTALRNSLFISTVGPTISLMLALPISWILVRTKIKGRGILDFVAMAPLSIPGTVLGIGALWAWIRFPSLFGSIWLLVIALVSAFFAYGVRATSSGLLQIGKELEESSYVLGAGKFVTFRRVLVPLLKPALATGWILLFSLFYRDVSLVILLWSPESMPLSVLAVDLWSNSGYTSLAALAVVDAAVFLLIISVVRRAFGTTLRNLGNY